MGLAYSLNSLHLRGVYDRADSFIFRRVGVGKSLNTLFITINTRLLMQLHNADTTDVPLRRSWGVTELWSGA